MRSKTPSVCCEFELQTLSVSVTGLVFLLRETLPPPGRTDLLILCIERVEVVKGTFFNVLSVRSIRAQLCRQAS